MIYVTLIIYFAILFFIGLAASKKVNSIEDFYVGGKNLGYWVCAFSARATGESGWLLLGLTGMGAMMGLQAFWVVIGEVLGVAACWIFMAKPFKRLTDKYGSVTVTDFFASHFKSKTHHIRLVSALILITFITIYVSAQIDATGTAFESFLGVNYFVGALIGFAIVMAYIFLGGFVAVAWSDVFQGIVMMIGLIVLPIAGYFALNLESGVSVSDKLTAIDPSLMSFFGTGGFSLINVMVTISFLMIGIGFLGSPQVFVRFISVKDTDEIRKGTWVAIIFTILTDVAAVAAGIFGRLLLTGPGVNPESVLGNSAQNVLPEMVYHIFPTIVIGLYVAAVLSAIMSTVDSLLVVASSAVTRDIYQQILMPKISTEKLTKISRNVTLIVAFTALAISFTVAILSPTRTIFWFVIFGWSGIAASFCPSMILSLFWKGFNEKGAIVCMLTGFSAMVFFQFVGVNLPVVGPYLTALSPLPPSFLLAIIVGVWVSNLNKENPNFKLL
jgi:sodium/proline symporter